MAARANVWAYVFTEGRCSFGWPPAPVFPPVRRGHGKLGRSVGLTTGGTDCQTAREQSDLQDPDEAGIHTPANCRPLGRVRCLRRRSKRHCFQNLPTLKLCDFLVFGETFAVKSI